MAKEAVAAGEPIPADSIAAVRRIVLLSLSDQLVTAPSEAEEQANLFRELLNHRCSPGLLQHITTRLTQLQAVGPNVKMTPRATWVRTPRRSERSSDRYARSAINSIVATVCDAARLSGRADGDLVEFRFNV